MYITLLYLHHSAETMVVFPSLEKTLETPWTARRSNQSKVFTGKTDGEAETSVYFGHLMWRTDSLEKILMLGKIKGRGEGGNRGWDGWMASPTQWTWVWASSGSWWRTGRLVCCSPWGLKELDTTEWLNWIDILGHCIFFKSKFSI